MSQKGDAEKVDQNYKKMEGTFDEVLRFLMAKQM